MKVFRYKNIFLKMFKLFLVWLLYCSYNDVLLISSITPQDTQSRSIKLKEWVDTWSKYFNWRSLTNGIWYNSIDPLVLLLGLRRAPDPSWNVGWKVRRKIPYFHFHGRDRDCEFADAVGRCQGKINKILIHETVDFS